MSNEISLLIKVKTSCMIEKSSDLHIENHPSFILEPTTNKFTIGHLFHCIYTSACLDRAYTISDINLLICFHLFLL